MSILNNTSSLQALLSKANNLPTGGAEQATPVISVNASGLITATAGTKTSTRQLAFQPAKTITPTTASQIAVSSGYYTGGAITVEAIPSEYVIPSGVLSIYSSGNYNVTKYAIVAVAISDSGEDTSVEDGLIAGTLSNYTNDRVTTIGDYAFYSRSSLTTASFPLVTTIGRSAFYNCYKLKTVSFPVCTTIGNYAFSSCSSLTTVSFPKVTTIGNFAFGNCTSLTTASFPVCTFISNYAFYRGYNLKSLYLTGSSVCRLSGSSAFTSTPIGGYSVSAGTYGSIYVPASLLAPYQTTTNWAYFSSRFVTIDSSTKLITFTIGDVEYQAEDGMTWKEWFNSEYNFVPYLIEGSFIGQRPPRNVISYNGTPVTIDEKIVSNRSYINMIRQ